MENRKVINLLEEKQKIKPDNFLLRQSLLIFRALNNKFREKIIRLLANYICLCVSDIYIRLRFGQSQASQHLGILRSVNLVTAKKEGRFVYYSLNRGRITEVFDIAKKLANWDNTSVV